MTSKNLFSKLMKEDIRGRLWAVSLISLGFFFLYPVVAAFLAGEIKDYVSYQEGLRHYEREMLSWLSFENVAACFVMMVTAIVCGLSSFSYLNSRSKVDFYHSIPVKREKFFLANYINGILITLIPYTLFLTAAAVVAVMNGVDGAELWPRVLTGLVLNSIYYMLMYSVVVIAAMLTGNVIVGFLGTMVLSFLVPIFFGLIQGYFSSFFVTYYYRDDSVFEQLCRISPIMEYSYQYVAVIEGKVRWGAALAALLIALGFSVAGCILYKKRPSEAAGKAMAFAISRPLVRIPIVITSAIGLGLFFWSMRNNTGWAVFGLVFGALVSHCVIEVIYHFDFRKLFSCKIQLLGCLAAAFAVLCVFRYDLIGYDRYLPNASDVRHAAISMDGLNGWVSYGYTKKHPDGGYEWKNRTSSEYIFEMMEYQDMENLLAIASQGISNAEESRRNRMNPQIQVRTEAAVEEIAETTVPVFETAEEDLHSYYTICYTLNSGRKVYRRYTGNLEPVAGQIDQMIHNEQYQKGTFPVAAMNLEETAGVWFREHDTVHQLTDLNQEEMEKLLETYRKDFASLTVDRMKREYPIGLIRFTRAIDEEAIQWARQVDLSRSWGEYPYYYRTDFEVRDYYPVYPSFVETLRILKENGIEPGKYKEEMEIDRMVIYYPDKYEEVELVIRDAGELEQLMEISNLERGSYYNNLYQQDQIYGQVYIIGQDGIEVEHVTFPRNQVPEFVLERLKELM